MVLTIKLGLKPPTEGAKRRKPGFTRRIASSESDSNDSIPDALINQPSTSRTPIEKPQNNKTRIGGTPDGDKKKKNSFVRPNMSPEPTGFGSQRAIKALTGVNNGFVYQLKTKSDSAGEDDAGSDSSKEKDCNVSNESLVDSSLNEEIPEGTVIVQPEAAPDGEDDWYKSKEFKKQFTREKREKKDPSNQITPSSVESVFCTACNSQVNPFDKRTFFCHPVLSVVICKSCKEFYDSGPWKLDEDGIEEECRWCGEGGLLSCCDFCPKTFCKRCIIRNLGRGEFNRTTSQKKWKCYICEPSPLTELVAKCSALLKQPVKTEKKEKEKAKVNAPKKVVKEPKKEKKSLQMQDAAIAEEFLQYLVGNISNKALFMKSLVRLKKEVPNMQKLQMDLALKHVGEVKSVLKDLEACVQRKLYGDVHKSDSALDGTDPEDFDSPERKSKAQPDSAASTPEPKNEEAREDETHKIESAMDVPMDTTEMEGVEEASGLCEESSVDDVDGLGNVADAMDADDTEVNQTSMTGEEHIENNEKIMENSSLEDVDMEGNLGDDEANDNEDETNDIQDGDVTKETELKDKEQVDNGTTVNSKPLPENIQQEDVSDDETNIDASEDDGNDDEAEEDECPSSQHSARKVKVTPRLSRSRSESQGASPRASQEDTEAKLMSMIDGSDDDSSEESEGSDYSPKKSSRSKKSPGKAKKELSKKFSKSGKKDPESDADSDHDDATKKREGPGLDSSNPEGESGFDGIPGESSTEASQDEAAEKKEKVEKSKGLPTSKQDSETSEEESSEEESLPEQSDENDQTWGSKKAKKRATRLSRKKKKVEATERNSASEEEMELKKLEGIGGLKRKRNRNHGSGSDDASESEHDDQDVPKDDEEDVKTEQAIEKTADEESESEENPKKTKKPRKSPAKIDPKSREILSSDDSSSDESGDDESDECSGLKWKSLNSSSKKKKDSPEKVPEALLMEELDGDDEEEDDDDDEDDDEEVDGAGSKRSKRKAQKKAEEEEPEENDEDWDNDAGESRQNGTGGSGDGKKGRDDKGKKRNGKKETDDEDEEEENPEENGEEEEENDDENGEDEEEKDSDDEVGTKKTHPLLRVNISDSSDEEEEDPSSKKKGKKGKAAPKKKGKATKKKKRKEIDTDDYFTSSESENLSDEKPKRKRVTRSQTATSTEDSATELKKPRKRAKKQEHNTSSEADSSKETTKKRRGKGKKRRRIKVASESDSEKETKTQEDESQEDQKGSGASDDENDSPKKGRKHIRRVLKKSKLQAETLAAEEEEKERRKRIEEKRKEIITEEDEKAEKSAVVKTCILEKEKDTEEVVLEVDERIVEHLKPHQAEGIQFMFDSTFESIKKAEEKGGGCILAHCMGLGKTLQVISYLHTIMTCEDMKVNTCLVVAPLNTVLNWEAEFEKWTGHMDTGINVYELSSVKNNASRAQYLDHWHKKGGVMILGYAMYRNLSLLTHIRKKKEKAIFLKTLVDPGPDIVVCDEGHMLKNERSSISKAMNSINTRRRICLTGTPLQNNLIEYHCMVHFVKPNLLGTLREFKNRFVNPITNGQHSDSTARDVKIMKRRAHVLHNLLSGCVQRKDYTALTKFLPPKHEFVISVRLSEVQIKLYDHYLNTLSGRKDDGTKTQCTSLFSDYQALMNVWTHPRLLQLATQREDRNAARREMNDFVTSEEEDDESDESMKAFVISSDSDLEDPWASSKKKKEKADKPSTSNSSRPTRQTRRGQANNSDSDEEVELAGSSSDNDGGNNSDSSVEVVKSWNTRSRTKESGLSEGASTSAADFYIPPSPEKVNKWYSEFFSEDDSYRIELSGKLVLLFEILKMAESVGEKVLVFSQSLLSLDMIEDMLAHLDEKAQEERVNGEQDLENQIGGTGSWVKGEDYFRMDGSTAAHLRRRWSEIFNDLENIRARLFLISTRAGSLGTNLIAANRVIIFDANWNPSHDIQSIFRVYRFGQERATFIYRFIAQGTMEEKIYDRQVIKQSLSQRVVDEHQIERHFTSADLSELYNFVPDRLDDPDRPERPTPVLPKDFFLAELLKTQMKWIVKYHEHDSLLENQMEEELTEEERKQAWNDYDSEKNQTYSMPTMSRQMNPQDMENIYREGESILRMGEMMLNYPGQSNQYMMGHPNLAMGGPSVGMAAGGENNVRRLLELQSMFRAQVQQQQRQQLQQQQQQRLQMLRQAQAAGQQPDSASMRQLQQMALLQHQQQQQQQQQQQRLLQQQQLMKQRQQQQKASSSQGKAP